MSNFLVGLDINDVQVSTFSGNASTTAFTLPVAATTNGAAVHISGVRQVPTTDYSIAATTLTFTTAPPTGTNNIAVMYTKTAILNTPADASVTSAKIGNDQVDSQHLAAGSVDLEHMSSQSVDEDNLHISNAGANGQFLSKQSGDAGGLTWATVASSANPSLYYDDNDSALAFYATGAYRTVNLTSEVWDTDDLGSLSTNQVTLAAGTYLFQGGISCYMNDASTTLFDFRLRNVTDSSTAGVGGWLGSIDGNEDGNTLVNGRFTISGAKAFELQIYPNAGKAYKRSDQSGISGEEHTGSWLYLEKVG